MEKLEVDPKMFVMCRLCLDGSGVYQIVPAVKEKIAYCFDITVEPFDGLPQLICKKCEELLSKFYTIKHTFVQKQNNFTKNVLENITNKNKERQELLTDDTDSSPKIPRKKIRYISSSSSESDSMNQSEIDAKQLTLKKLEDKQSWQVDYSKKYMCGFCNSSWPTSKSLRSHISGKHKQIKMKYGKILKQFCKVAISKLDETYKTTKIEKTVRYSQAKFMTCDDPEYFILYENKTKSQVDSLADAVDTSNINGVHDSSYEEEELFTRHAKRKPLSSESSNETVVLDVGETHGTADQNKSVEEMSQTNECINLDDSSDNESDYDRHEEQKLHPSTTLDNPTYTLIRKIGIHCKTKATQKHQDYIIRNNKSDAYIAKQLKRKVLSVGNKMINKKKGINYISLLRFLENKNLNIQWSPRSKNKNAYCKDTEFIRINANDNVKMKNTEQDSYNSVGWGDYEKKECKTSNKHSEKSDDISTLQNMPLQQNLSLRKNIILLKPNLPAQGTSTILKNTQDNVPAHRNNSIQQNTHGNVTAQQNTSIQQNAQDNVTEQRNTSFQNNTQQNVPAQQNTSNQKNVPSQRRTSIHKNTQQNVPSQRNTSIQKNTQPASAPAPASKNVTAKQNSQARNNVPASQQNTSLQETVALEENINQPNINSQPTVLSQNDDLLNVSVSNINALNNTTSCSEGNTVLDIRKLLNANPVANPKQLPKKFHESKVSKVHQTGPPVDDTTAKETCMPIIMSTTSLAQSYNLEDDGNEVNTDPTSVTKLASNNEEQKATAPRIKVKPVSELMSKERLSLLHNSDNTIALHNNSAVNKLVVLLPSQPNFLQNNIMGQTLKKDESEVILNTVELPNTKTNSPFTYLKTLLQMHNITLLDSDSYLNSSFQCLVKFKVIYKQESKEQVVTLCMSLFCSKNMFCMKVKDRLQDNIDMSKITANWQWEIIKACQGEVVNKLLQNAQKLGEEIYQNANNFVCLLRSISCKNIDIQENN